MILWPGALPQQLLVEGYEEQLSNMLIRTEMDAGPAKVRRRFTAAPRPVNGQIVVTPAQLVFFRAWYYNVLLGGSLRFGWTDPFTTDAITNLLTNGGFDSATTGWTPTDCTLASVTGGIFGNCLELTSTGGDYQECLAAATLVVGHLYNVEFYIKLGTSDDGSFESLMEVYDGSITGTAIDDWVAYNYSFTGVTANSNVYLKKDSSHADHSGTMLFDEVSLVDITAGIMEMRFIEPPTLSPIDPTAIRINMALEILP